MVKLLIVIFLGLLVAGCLGERRKSTDVKEEQSSTSAQKGSNEMLNFSAEALEAGKKLPNIYENKEQKYSIRYAADSETPTVDEDGDVEFNFVGKDQEDSGWDINITVANDSDYLGSLLSAKLFSEAVVSQLKEQGNFDDVKALRYEKSKGKDITMFFLETRIRNKLQVILLQQYYFISKNRLVVFTGGFSDQENMKRFERDMQIMVSTFKFDN